MPPSTPNFLVDMVRYNTWANRELIGFCRELPDELMARTTPGVFGTIPDTFEHLARAESRFLAAVAAELPPHIPERGVKLDLGKAERLFGILAGTWEEVAREPGLGDRTIDYRGTKLRVSIVFAQLLNHGSEHRTQIATVLGVAGIEAPAVDAWTYGVATA